MSRTATQDVSVAPTWNELLPWTDRRGRFHKLRAASFALLLAPGLWLLANWLADMLGPRAVNAAIHSTGYYAVWILIASLVVTPLKTLAILPNLVVVRRMIGNAALVYAVIHLLLYATDQNWRLLTIGSEIVRRFYLTIGFVALLGLVALGVTSTDGWARRLGVWWKRLHRIVYAIMVLGLVHYVLQSKLDVSQALLAIGVFGWLMIWRMLPAGKDRTWAPLLAVSAAATLLTLACEYGWYRFGTRIDPVKVVLKEADILYGLRPAGQVLLLGLLATLLTEVRRIGMGPAGQTLLFTMAVYAGGGLVDDIVAFFVGWSIQDATPDGVSMVGINVVWMALLALLGTARWKLRREWHRHLIDAIWIACLLEHIILVGVSSPGVAVASAGLIVAFAIVLGQRVWAVSRGAAITLIPLALLLAYEAAAHL